MSDELQKKLRFLEEDFFTMPVAVQKNDLQEINRIRIELGMPIVDQHLKEQGAAEVPEVETATSEAIETANSFDENPDSSQTSRPSESPIFTPDHSEARAIYQAFLKKSAELKIHQEYADEVAKATSGSGQTLVKPLATMGNKGGPLLCDHCGKPMILEGGDYHKLNADVGWKKNPDPKWRSWIFGGMVVEIQTNGTLRIYHGYPGANPKDCCNVANQQDSDARKQYVSERSKYKDLLYDFIMHEFSEMKTDDQIDLLNEILNTMFVYDPGLGINQPHTN